MVSFQMGGNSSNLLLIYYGRKFEGFKGKAIQVYYSINIYIY